MRITLRAKLLTGFFLLIAIPCAILGAISYRQAANALQTAIEQQLVTSVQSAASLVRSTLYSTQKVVEMAADDPGLIQAANGRESLGQVVERLRELQKRNSGVIEEILIIDRSGQVAASAQGGLSSVSVKERAYFTEALAGKSVIGDLMISKLSGHPVIAIAQPLKENGAITGVLTALVDFSAISREVGNLQAGQTGYGYMLDKTGLVAAHPNKDLLLKENLTKHPDEQVRNVAQNMAAGKTGKEFYTFQGVYKLAAYAPVDQFSIAMTVPVEEYMAPAAAILRNTLIISFGAILIAMGLALFLVHSIVKPVNQLRESMARAGNGDLASHSGIKDNNEVGDLARSFNSMIDAQHLTVQEIQIASSQLFTAAESMAASSEQVAATSESISAAMENLSKETEEGNKAAMDASQALLQLSSLIQLAKMKADAAVTNSRTTMKAAEQGRAKVDESVAKMKHISEHTGNIGRIIGELNDYSQQIGAIIDTITAIAAQTDLLALNAAIEAARAGENGRGFAVVAEEVRKLAEQSHNGAQEITALVKKVAEKTEDAVNAMDTSGGEVEQGVVMVNAAGAALDRILEAVRHSVAEIEGITEVTTEEVASSEQIIRLIELLTSMIENTAAHTEEVSAAAEEQSATMQTIAGGAEETMAMASQLREIEERFTM